MPFKTFQYLAGLTLLLTHIGCIVLIGTSNRFDDFRDQIGSVLIIAPITLVYALNFMRYVVGNALRRPQNSADIMDTPAALTMYLVVAAFCGGLVYVVVKFVFVGSSVPNEFKMWLGGVETAFGTLIGLVFERLFGVMPKPESAEKSVEVDPAAG